MVMSDRPSPPPPKKIINAFGLRIEIDDTGRVTEVKRKPWRTQMIKLVLDNLILEKIPQKLRQESENMKQILASHFLLRLEEIEL